METTKDQILQSMQTEVEKIVMNKVYNEIMSNLGIYLVLKRLPLVEVENVINSLPEIIRPPQRYVATMGVKSEDGEIVLKEYDKTKPIDEDTLKGILLDLSIKMMSESTKDKESLMYKEFEIE